MTRSYFLHVSYLSQCVSVTNKLVFVQQYKTRVYTILKIETKAKMYINQSK